MRAFYLTFLLGYANFSKGSVLPGRHFMSTRDAQPSNSSKTDPMYQLSTDPEFHYEILRDLAIAPFEGADVGEVLVAANQIVAGDFESFYAAFQQLATRVHNTAKAIDSTKYPVSARNAYFRAATYYRSADFFLHGNWSDPRINDIWDKHLAAFNAAIGLLPIPGQRIELCSADKNFTIPAIFFGSGRPGPRPTIILGNGYDGAQEETYHVIGRAILERGMNVITYEGPGQPTVRRQQNIGFIPEWEKVVTPVVDYLLTRPEVDAKSIGLWGYSFGGYLAPRAAAFDHRIAAVFAIDGLYNFGQSILNGFPDFLQAIFHAGNATAFNKILEGISMDPATPAAERWALQQGLWSFKAKTPFEFTTTAQLFNLTGITDKIEAPVFIGSAENDFFFPGQGKLLSDALGSKGTFQAFQNNEGAGEHCSVGANVLLSQVTMDWFENILSQRKN